MYYKKATKFGSQNFGYRIWFCTRLLYLIKTAPDGGSLATKMATFHLVKSAKAGGSSAQTATLFSKVKMAMLKIESPPDWPHFNKDWGILWWVVLNINWQLLKYNRLNRNKILLYELCVLQQWGCYGPHNTIQWKIYHQVSNIRRTLVGNEIVDHSDVVGASPVGAASTTSSFST